MAALRFRSNRNVTRELTYAHRAIIKQCFSCAGGQGRAADPGTCRVFTEKCLPEVCRQLKQYHWIDCDQPGMRNLVRKKLKQCTDFQTCFDDLVDHNSITPANCRANPDACLDYACDKVRSMHSVRCENSNNRLYLREILVNCNAPQVDMCLQKVVILKQATAPTPSHGVPYRENVSPSRNIEVVAQPITPANCRANPEYCLPYACSQAKRMNGRINCDQQFTRERIASLLKNCYTPDVVQCLKDVSSWQFDDSGITSANCRARPHSCVTYACNYVESRQAMRCYQPGIREALSQVLKNCFAPKVDICLNSFSFRATQRPEAWPITPANCRSKPHNCLTFACEKLLEFHGKSCTNHLKNFLVDTLEECRAPHVDICLRSMKIPSSLLTESG